MRALIATALIVGLKRPRLFWIVIVLCATCFPLAARSRPPPAAPQPVAQDQPSPRAAAQVFSNPSLITIPASGNGQQAEAFAAPYPSIIVVAGVTAPVGKITVSLKQISHGTPTDVDVLLVGPGGVVTLVLMSDVVGGTPWTGQTYTFDDAALALLPGNSQPPPSGSFKPTNYAFGAPGADVFPIPAPMGPYLSPAPSGADTLAAFSGRDPNGVWSLYVSDGAPGGEGFFAGGWELTITPADVTTAGQLIISEFRLRGLGGENNEFIDLYNTTGALLVTKSADGSAGLAVAASDGVARCVVPNGTVIPAGGHFLCTNSGGYGLGAYPSGSGTTATGNVTYTTDVPQNAGIAIFNNSTGGGSFSAANRLDAVGSTSEGNTIYREGTGYPALTPSNLEHAFVRRLPGGCVGSASSPDSGNCTSPALMTTTPGPTSTQPQDTGNNATDFIFVDANGASFGAGQRLGAPGPQNLAAPGVLDGAASLTMSDPCVADTAPPNRVRDLTPGPVNTSSLGTIDIRRAFTNNAGVPLSRLRFRIVDISTFPSVSGVADLRPRTSSDIGVTVGGPPCDGRTSAVTVRGTTLEEPPAQPNGGGFNSSLSVGAVTSAAPLAIGATIHVRFLFGVQQTGVERICVVSETVPASASQVLCTPTPATTAGQLIISEVRLRGPNGATDEFIDLYNTTGAALTARAADGSTGLAVAASDGVARCVVVSGTVIAAGGHFLCANSGAYSLALYPSGTGVTATADLTYATDILDNAGIAIFNNSTGGGSFSAANRLDAAGSASEANTVYTEKTGYPALTPSNIDYAFVRKLPGGCTGSGAADGSANCTSAALMSTTPGPTSTQPQDTGNNASDFIFVETGTGAGTSRRLGAPGPQNRSSPVVRDGVASLTVLDPCASNVAAPNRIRDLTPNPGGNSAFGTIEIRKTFTNNAGVPLTRLRFRIVDLSTFPSLAGVSDLRPRTSASGLLVTVDRPPCGAGTTSVIVQGTSVEQPPSQTTGGGYNSSLSVGAVTSAAPLAIGATIDVRFLLGVQQTGVERFCVVSETVPASPAQVSCLNVPPVAGNGALTTSEDTAGGGTLVASDVDATPLTYSIVTNGVRGTAVVTNAATGAYTYTPSANANGADSFTFKSTDGIADSNVGTVTLTITPINDTPTASPGVLTTNEDTAGSGTLVGADVEGSPLSFAVVVNGAKGTAVVTNAATGAYTYTPAANANGADSFTFKASDGSADSSVATVTVTITPINDAPAALPGTLTTNEDTAGSGTLVASDVDATSPGISIVGQGAKGTAVVTNATTGAYTYTPAANQNGADSFTFKANDGSADSNVATVTVTITSINDTPTASPGTLTTNEDTIGGGTVMATDVEGSPLTFVVVANGAKGTAVVTNAATGAYTYTPAANANGADSFTFKVNDGAADSNTATVAVTISPVNDPPTMTGIASQTIEANASTGALTFTVGDVDGSVASLTTSGASSNPTLVPTANIVFGGSDGTRTVTVVPAPNQRGTATITVTASDGALTAVNAFLLTVRPRLALTITSHPASSSATSPFVTLSGTTSVMADLPELGLERDTSVPVDGTQGGTGDGAVTAVSWASSRGPVGTATGTTNWSGEVPLFAGANIITVTATDAGGLTSAAAVTINVASFLYYFAEGATGSFFDLELGIANPNAVEAPVQIAYLKDDGTTVSQTLTIPAQRRATILVDGLAGLENTAVSSVVTSTSALPLAVERTMRWDDTGYGAHTEKATAGARLQWFFAEGSQGFFDTFILLANPQPSANTATVTFLRESGGPVTKTYDLLPTSRTNVFTGAIAELVGTSFGVTVTFAQPGVAERAMYFGSPLFNGGHESAGVSEASTNWFLAEGAVGDFFDTFVLVSNPNPEPATVTFTFLREAGAPVVRTQTLAGNARLTMYVDEVFPGVTNGAVATQVTADRPVVAERAMYWPGGFSTWFEAHNAFGVTDTATRWALGEGRKGGPPAFETYILLANPGASAATVTITYVREGSNAPVLRTYAVPAASRFTVFVNGIVELGDGERFGAVIDSTAPIAVERAMYSNASGVIWAAGTNATATRIP